MTGSGVVASNRSEYNARWRASLFKEAIDVLGGKCARCGDSEWSRLEIDHVNNDAGGPGRKPMVNLLSEARRSGWSFHRLNVQVLCANCNILKELSRIRALHTHTPKAISRRKEALSLKAKVFRAYGPGCRCCGVSDLDVLSIQHVLGGGKAHRKAVSNGWSGEKFYAHLKRTHRLTGEWPQDPPLEVLCFSCHRAEDSRGGCPGHE